MARRPAIEEKLLAIGAWGCKLLHVHRVHLQGLRGHWPRRSSIDVNFATGILEGELLTSFLFLDWLDVVTGGLQQHLVLHVLYILEAHIGLENTDLLVNNNFWAACAVQ